MNTKRRSPHVLLSRLESNHRDQLLSALATLIRQSNRLKHELETTRAEHASIESRICSAGTQGIPASELAILDTARQEAIFQENNIRQCLAKLEQEEKEIKDKLVASLSKLRVYGIAVDREHDLADRQATAREQRAIDEIMAYRSAQENSS